MSNILTDGSEHYKPRLWRIVEGEVVEESDVVVHTFNVGDTEDPDLIAGFQILDWQESEAGQWVMNNCIDKPYWLRGLDQLFYGYQYRIVARLTKQNQTFFELKYK